jgi:membrane protease subunit HflK
MKRHNNSPRKVLNIAAIAIVVIFMFTLLFSTVYSLNEDEDAVIVTFGNPTLVENSGLHFKIPFVQDRYTVDMSVRGMEIGYNNEGETIENESLMITKDFNFVSVDFYLEWQVTNAIDYVYASEDPVAILKTLTMSYIRDTVGSYNVDEVLTTGKAQIQSEIRDKLIERLETENIGITVRSIAIQDAEPPTEAVSNAFKAVEDAKQKAEEIVMSIAGNSCEYLQWYAGLAPKIQNSCANDILYNVYQLNASVDILADAESEKHKEMDDMLRMYHMMFQEYLYR